MSLDVTGFITWIRTFLDEVYETKGQGGGLSVDEVYPVGSIYMSVNSTSPQTLFGGTWEQLTSTFLYASSTPTNNNAKTATAGASTVSLTASQMPRHTHTQNSHNHTQNAHTHIQDAHTHIQDSHNHSQNAHSHRLNNSAVVYNASGNYVQNGSGGGTKSSLNTNLNVGTDNATASNNATTATNQSTTATNQNATATNQSTTATNKYTGGTGTSQSASNGSAHENMPPYMVVNMWKRTA